MTDSLFTYAVGFTYGYDDYVIQPVYIQDAATYPHLHYYVTVGSWDSSSAWTDAVSYDIYSHDSIKGYTLRTENAGTVGAYGTIDGLPPAYQPIDRLLPAHTVFDWLTLLLLFAIIGGVFIAIFNRLLTRRL